MVEAAPIRKCHLNNYYTISHSIASISWYGEYKTLNTGKHGIQNLGSAASTMYYQVSFEDFKSISL